MTRGRDEAFSLFFEEHNRGRRNFSFLELGNITWRPPEGRAAYLWLERGEVSAVHGEGDGLELGAGDVIALDKNEEVRLEGQGRFWAIDVETTGPLPFTGISRLADLEDTSGGCNVAENAFRRLQIVWDPTGPRADGHNVLGCHVVWIAEASSRTHHHPMPPVVGGEPQHEMYLVLDPAEHGLQGGVGQPGVWTYPRAGAWERADFTPLEPGDVVFIPAGVVHRAVDVLAGVVAIPGFKPGNELFLDAQIRKECGGPAHPTL